MKLDTLLVGLDDSEGSRAALEWAMQLAARVGARIVAAQVFEPLAHLAELGPGTDLRALRDAAALDLEQRLCAPLRERALPYTTLILEGTPAKALSDAAESEQADLLIVGARRRTLLGALVLGSTSKHLPTESSRPVTIVPLPRSA